MQDALAIAVVGIILAAGTATACFAGDYSAMDCEELWQARNQIFADKGFCFKAERSIAVFGKRCFPPFGRLDATEAKIVEEIRMQERSLHCKIEG